MKKIILATVLFSFLFMGAGVAFAQVQTAQGCKLNTNVTFGDETFQEGDVVGRTLNQNLGDLDGDGIDETVDSPTPNWGGVCLIDRINGIVRWIVIFALAASVVLVAIGGLMYMGSGANPDLQGKAQKWLLAAVVGLIITGLAFVVPGIISALLGA